MLDTHSFVQDELPEVILFCGSKWSKAQVEADLLLMCRDGGLTLGVFFDQGRVQVNFMGDESEQIVQDFERLLGGKTAVSLTKPI
jgi:hypothetical protein